VRWLGWSIAALVIVLIIAFIAYFATTASISALPQPGSAETALANRVKNWYIQRAARAKPPPPPPRFDRDSAAGLFGMACAFCHGPDGRHPSPTGQAMYPRALDLGSNQVQSLSDAELYWVIGHGIRLTGMPGFGHILSPNDLWQLTLFVRHLPPSAPTP